MLSHSVLSGSFDSNDCNPPVSVHAIFQIRTLEWVAICYSRGSSQPRGWAFVSCISCIGRQILYHFTDYSPPGSSVHRIFQARIVKWVAICYSRGSSQPRNWTCISCSSCTGRWILSHCATWEDWAFSKATLACAYGSLELTLLPPKPQQTKVGGWISQFPHSELVNIPLEILLVTIISSLFHSF